MRRLVVLIAFALFAGGPTVAHACPDAEYKKHLTALRALTSAVAGEQPEPTALASFFKALPPDFWCFNRIFGYSDGPAPLYWEPQLYPLFPKIAAAVPKPDYARKLVGLAVNARWEADQTGALQDVTRSVLDSDTRLFVKLLSELNPESERSVWAFLFGAPTRAISLCRIAFRATYARPAHEAATSQGRLMRALSQKSTTTDAVLRSAAQQAA